MTGEARSQSFSGVFADENDRALNRRDRQIKRVARRIFTAAANGNDEMAVRGGRFGFLKTVHDPVFYKDVAESLRHLGIGIMVDYESFTRTETGFAGVGMPAGVPHAIQVDTVLLTMRNGEELPHRPLRGTQKYPPLEAH